MNVQYFSNRSNNAISSFSYFIHIKIKTYSLIKIVLLNVDISTSLQFMYAG